MHPGEGLNPHSTLRPPSARAAGGLALEEGGFFEGYDSLVWGDQIQRDGHFLRGRDQTFSERLRKNVAKFGVGPDRSSW